MLRIAVVLLLSGAVSVQGKGSVVRPYNPPQRNSKIWAVAGGAAVGAGTAYVGYKMYTSYHRWNSYNHYRSTRGSEWRQRYPERATSCAPPSAPQESETEAWLIAQIIMNHNTSNDHMPSLEVNLFREMAFRSPCRPATEVVIMLKCTKPTDASITAAERDNPRVCTRYGSVQSLPEEHLEARRRLLQTTEYEVYEVAIGARSRADTQEMEMALREIVEDPQGGFKTGYQSREVQSVYTRDASGAAVMPAMMLLIFACLAVLL